MKIKIKTIPHANHRYETVGDYWVDDEGTKYIVVSDMGNEDYELLVAIHELIEQHLCLKRGIKEREITDFDIEFEKNRPEGNTDEPGDAPDAPYRKEHFFATNIERLISEQLGVDWKTYDDTVNSL